MPQRVAILAIGSELLSGQIVNRNAPWLAERLTALGLLPCWHLAVDDIEADISAALDLLAKDHQIIIVTGGLGPTSDDLTRQAVAKWAGEELRYDAGSWTHIEAQFARLGRQPPPSNRQQCYFPASARVLPNQAGTANAFVLTARDREVWVLPGPPREVEAVWCDHVQPALQSRQAPEDRYILRRWRTIGIGESHLAEMVSPTLAAHSVWVAYRAHQPYVELKIRFPAKEASAYADLCTALTAILAPRLYEQDDDDHAASLCQRVAALTAKGGGVVLSDAATQGQVMELLAPKLRDALAVNAMFTAHADWSPTQEPGAKVSHLLNRTPSANSSPQASPTLNLALAGFDATGAWAAGIRLQENSRQLVFRSPYHGEALRGRNLKAVAFLACKAWLDLLDELTAGANF